MSTSATLSSTPTTLYAKSSNVPVTRCWLLLAPEYSAKIAPQASSRAPTNLPASSAHLELLLAPTGSPATLVLLAPMRSSVALPLVKLAPRARILAALVPPPANSARRATTKTSLAAPPARAALPPRRQIREACMRHLLASAHLDCSCRKIIQLAQVVPKEWNAVSAANTRTSSFMPLMILCVFLWCCQVTSPSALPHLQFFCATMGMKRPALAEGPNPVETGAKGSSVRSAQTGRPCPKGCARRAVSDPASFFGFAFPLSSSSWLGSCSILATTRSLPTWVSR
mmetsp:Transcript_6146/g.14265  ORF Transcript_6146/g.14265 Transcript_6146/m.14265 type:complete len:284 (-) Transcript_6146:1621-2472(-)